MIQCPSYYGLANMNAVSAFGDAEDPWNVHYRKLLLYYRRICSGLVFEHDLSMALAECKRDMFKQDENPFLPRNSNLHFASKGLALRP